MKFAFLGEAWRLIRRKMRRHDGQCCVTSRTITLDSRLDGQRELEVILHELAHASDWWKDERFAEMYGRDAAALLWQLGWRKQQQQ